MKLIAVTVGLVLGSGFADARSGSTYHHSSRAVSGVQRDANGKIHRSSTAKNEFKKTHPCPSGGTGKSCNGYVIDHVVPLKRGGADAPSNMQWQTVSDAKAKDRVE